MKSKTTSKARVHEMKGDQFKAKKKHEKAFEHYQKALELDETRLQLYDKIIKLHEEFSDNWTEDDFAYNVHLTMKKQEIMDPTFKRINARVEPEYKEVHGLIKNMLGAKTRKAETKFVEDIVTKEKQAIYPLIDFILGFKELGKKAKQKKTDNPKRKKH